MAAGDLHHLVPQAKVSVTRDESSTNACTRHGRVSQTVLGVVPDLTPWRYGRTLDLVRALMLATGEHGAGDLRWSGFGFGLGVR